MYLDELYKKNDFTLSFEIFPFKKWSNKKIYEMLFELSKLNPDFISITYGAGGTKRGLATLDIASVIKDEYNIEPMIHLTGINSSKEEINQILDEVKRRDIKNILALRGDINKDINKNIEFEYAKDLTKYIKSKNKEIVIAGACYPQGHSVNSNIDEEIEHLKQKIEAGAKFLITQLFFENERFYEFKDKLVKKNINIEVIPGIIPVTNKKQLNKIISLSNASVPKDLLRMLNKYEDNKQALKEAGTIYTSKQIIDLLSYKTKGIHLYTLNNHEITKKIKDNIDPLIKLNSKII